MNKTNVLIIALFLALSVFFMRHGLFEQTLVWGYDTPKIMYPLLALGHESFRAFHLPLWTPDIFSGFPIGSEGQVAWYYPFNVLHLIFSLPLAVNLLYLLHIFAAGIFTYLYCRTLRLTQLASIFAGIVFMFNGFIIAHLQFFNFVYAYPYLPLFLLIIEWGIKKKNLWFFYGLGAVFGLQLFSGHPNIPMMSLIYILPYWLLRSWQQKKQLVVGVAIFVLTSALITLPYLLLTLGLTPLSIRANGVDFLDATNSSFSWFDLISLIHPHFFFSTIPESWVFAPVWHFWTYWGQVETMGYVGISTLFFALFAFTRKAWKQSWIFLVLLGLSFFLALGKNNPLYIYVLEVPLLGGLRAPGRYMYLVDFSLVMLAAIGLSYLTQLHKTVWRWYGGMVFLGVFLIGLTMWGNSYVQDHPTTTFDFIKEQYEKLGYIGDTSNQAVFLEQVQQSFANQTSVGIQLIVVSIVLTGLYLYFRKNQKVVLILACLIIGVITFDMVYFAQKVNRWQEESSIRNSQSTTVLQLQKQVNYTTPRVYTYTNFWSDMMPNQNSPRHIPDANGFASLPLQRFENWQTKAQELVEVGNPILFQKGSVGNIYKLDANNAEVLQPIANPLPRAYITTQVSFASNGNEALTKLTNSTGTGEVILETSDTISPPTSTAIVLATIETYTPDRVTVNYTSATEGVLVLTDTYYPGWKAFIDTKESPIYPANYLYRGIKVPAGTHQVVYKYEPKFFALSLLISLGTMGILIGYLLFKCMKRKVRS